MFGNEAKNHAVGTHASHFQHLRESINCPSIALASIEIFRNFLAKNSKAMQHVFAESANAQVFYPVVSFDSILMVNHHPFWYGAKKSLGYKAMTGASNFAIVVKRIAKVTMFRNDRLHNVSELIVNSWGGSSNLSKARRLVCIAKAGYWFPRFHIYGAERA